MDNSTSRVLDNAFLVIIDLISKKDEEIKLLQEENILLKNKLKIYESTNINNEFQKTISKQETPNFQDKYTQDMQNIHISKNNNVPIHNQNNPNLNRELKTKLMESDNITNNYNSERPPSNKKPNLNNSKNASQSSPLGGSPFKSLRNTGPANNFDVQFNTQAHSNIVTNENQYVYNAGGSIGVSGSYNTNKDKENLKINSNSMMSPVLSSTSNPIDSRIEVKTFLNEVKSTIPAREFKEFIKYIKILTDKSKQVLNRKDIFDNVNRLFGTEYKDLYTKFELILSVKK